MADKNDLTEPGDDGEFPTAPAAEPFDPSAGAQEPRQQREEASSPPPPEPTIASLAEETSAEQKYENMLGALREERASKAQLSAEMASLRGQVQSFETLKTELNEFRQQRASVSEQDKFDQDPAEYLKAKTAELSDTVNNLVHSTHQQTQAQTQEAALRTAIQGHAQAFAAETPDYLDALSYMHQDRMKEYEALGVPAQHREAYFEQESMNLGRHALLNRQNPAQIVYNLAKAKGFSATAPQRQAPPPLKAVPQHADAQVNRMQRGVVASGTLNSGQAPQESLLSRIEEMSDNEFDKFWDSEVKPSHR